MALVALGVSGGIGAYKAVEVARRLQQRGHGVAAVMTTNAERFVGPLTFEAITQRRVATDQFAPGVNADIDHIALATEADLLLVAPATANVIGKFASGVADDFLSSLYIATTAPVLLAPAMNTNMLAHPASASEPPDPGRSGRTVRRSRRGVPGLWLGGEGPPGRAGTDCRGGRHAAARPGRVGRTRATRDRRADVRGYRPRPLPGQPVDRAGWVTPWRPRRRRAGRACCSCPVRRSWSHRPAWKWLRSEAHGRCMPR